MIEFDSIKPTLLLVLFSLHAVSAMGQSRTPPDGFEGDIASKLVQQVDQFLLRKIDESVGARSSHWQRQLWNEDAGPDGYYESIEPQRIRLAKILGVRGTRIPFREFRLDATTNRPAKVATTAKYDVWVIDWPVIRNLSGSGLLLEPKGVEAVANIVAIPDADQTPEQIAGLDGPDEGIQFARRLAENGCRVVVPTLVSRKLEKRGHALLTNREFIYRSAYELGHHIIGYELQKVLACIDQFALDKTTPMGVCGYGEGGMLALYAGALDSRIDLTCVSGYFAPRENLWQQPISRNVFGLLEQFGDAEIATMIAPRKLIIEAAMGPVVTLPGQGGAPAELTSPQFDEVEREVSRAVALLGGNKSPGAALWKPMLLKPSTGLVADETVRALTISLAKVEATSAEFVPVTKLAELPNQSERQARQVLEMDQHNQWLLENSATTRRDFMKPLDRSSLSAFKKTIEPFREVFRKEVVGDFGIALRPFNERRWKMFDEEKWTGYGIVLDVFDEVFAYGILCVPKNITAGERRPVVVCQHGLEGRPRNLVTGDHHAYHDFAAKLAERGFITFAPQNLYIFEDRFRTLQRKAYPLKKTLFSIMVPQHQQIVHWLGAQPNVDPKRIAFYGLSYGGKSAMRIPPLVKQYCLSICSADFNDWVWKNASTRSPYSYVWTGEYEIFEFNLGRTFNYAEMAALIAPRPFMVERGHFDGVAPDDRVAFEYAKVRHLYQAQLGIGDRTEIEWFAGPHTINGTGTFDFLHRHLDWPAAESSVLK